MFLIPIPAFAGSYPGLLHNAKQSLVVELGEAKPAFRVVEQRGLQPASILVKRPPARHTNGDAALQKASGARVCGPAAMRIAAPVEPLPGSGAACALGLQGREKPTLPPLQRTGKPDQSVFAHTPGACCGSCLPL